MTTAYNNNDEQIRMWNGVSGRAWIDAQELLDRLYKPFEDLLVDVATAKSPRSVLDVGCGTGATTVAIARRLTANGRATGIDISEPMIAVARARAEDARVPAHFICADAQVYPFAPAGVDMIVSRFGVMFFDNPVRAFANLRRAASDNAALRCITWRSGEENPFMTTAERAAAPLLPALPPRQPDAPGQFGFANEHRVSRILADAGWSDIDLRPIDVACSFPEQALVPYVTRFGPLARVLPDVDDRTRARVIDTVRAAFDRFVDGEDVRFTAACWMVAGSASFRAKGDGRIDS
jgi:SAM-dependent methyltransferase